MAYLFRLFFDSGASHVIWTHFYENTVINENYTSNEKFSRTIQGNYYVTRCFFNGIEDIVINININDQTKLLISNCVFNGTKTPYYTVYSNQGSCVIYRTCGTKSIQTIPGIIGVFLYSQISLSNTNNKNILEDSTVFDCGDSLDKGGSIHRLEYGNLSYSRNNITNNKCSYDVSLQIYSIHQYNISQSSFIDNKANYRCFYIGYNGPHQFYLCNIIRNNANQYCFILTQATVIFESCSIKNNNSTQTFYLYLSSSATIINSDYDGQTSSATIQHSINNYYNELSHLSTGLCEAKNKIQNSYEDDLNKTKKFAIFRFFPNYHYYHIIDTTHILTNIFMTNNYT